MNKFVSSLVSSTVAVTAAYLTVSSVTTADVFISVLSLFVGLPDSSTITAVVVVFLAVVYYSLAGVFDAELKLEVNPPLVFLPLVAGDY